eukprot:scaffold1085_cov407-Prasinococcus_capsulatus_cf.AAC.40
MSFSARACCVAGEPLLNILSAYSLPLPRRLASTTSANWPLPKDATRSKAAIVDTGATGEPAGSPEESVLCGAALSTVWARPEKQARHGILLGFSGGCLPSDGVPAQAPGAPPCSERPGGGLPELAS